MNETRLIHKTLAAHAFPLYGIARAGPTPGADHLRHWLQQGCHADMDWLQTQLDDRLDPRRVLPGCRSVIVVARNYYAPRPAAPDAQAGRVSRYAWGRDYHKVLGKQLKKLGTDLRERFPAEGFFWSVDTGPVQERAWAAAAGVGWIGKHGLVLHPDYGSWLFLGVVLTTLELEPTPPLENRCQDCTRCIDACPTQAIVAPGVVDARRCIAWHTVENRGAVPPQLARHFGDTLFGCDRCQEACPCNREPVPTDEPAFIPRPDRAWLVLDRVEAMTEDDFDQHMRATPLRRPGLAGLQRNAAIVRANLARQTDETPF